MKFSVIITVPKRKTETKIIDTKMLKNYDFWLLEVCFSGIDHHLAPDCCHRNLTENRIWLCITNFLNKQSKSLRKKSKNSGAAAPLKISREKSTLSVWPKNIDFVILMVMLLLKENPTTKLKMNYSFSQKRLFSNKQTQYTKKHWNLKNNRQTWPAICV